MDHGVELEIDGPVLGGACLRARQRQQPLDDGPHPRALSRAHVERGPVLLGLTLLGERPLHFRRQGRKRGPKLVRRVSGEPALAGALRDEIREQVAAWRSFPRYLATLAVSHAPPLGLFSRFRLERSGGRRGINVKLNAMLLLVNAMRAYAIDLGLDETNTLERLEAATRAGGCFSRAEADDVRESYETIFTLRLRHQLARLAAGQPPDNLLDPSALARSEQQRLKEAFRAIRRLQGRVRVRYFTEAL